MVHCLFQFSSFPVSRLFPSMGCLFRRRQAGARFSGRIRSTCLRKIVPETVFRHDLALAVQAPCFLCIRGRSQAADGMERSIVPTAGGRSVGTNHHIEWFLFMHRVQPFMQILYKRFTLCSLNTVGNENHHIKVIHVHENPLAEWDTL